MRQVECGKYVCSLCGEQVELAPEARVETQMHGSSGAPNMRVVLADGKEVHRCEQAPMR
jgi:hypothetical protein